MKNDENFIPKLFATLEKCSNQNKNRIYEETMAIKNIHPLLEPQTYQIQSMGKFQQLFLLKGPIKVIHPLDKKEYPVLFQIQFIDSYPRVSPSIRIINPNPQQYAIIQPYKSGEHFDGTCLISCQESLNWNEKQSSLSRCLKQIIDQFQAKFPFDKNQNYNPPPPQYISPSSQSQLQLQPQQQLKQELDFYIDSITENIVKDLKYSKQNLRKLNSQLEQIDNEQNQINWFKENLNENLSIINNLFTEGDEFIEINRTTFVTNENIEQIIIAQDDSSNQIVEIISTVNALNDTYRYNKKIHKQYFFILFDKNLSFIQNMFTKGQSELENCISYTRKISQQEFDNKLLLRKILINK